MRNIFNTLNEALEAENLLDTFPFGYNLNYGETIRYANDGIFVSVTRFNDGTYERPISYKTKAENFVTVAKDV